MASCKVVLYAFLNWVSVFLLHELGDLMECYRYSKIESMRCLIIFAIGYSSYLNYVCSTTLSQLSTPQIVRINCW